jgi:hypothetical protein
MAYMKIVSLAILAKAKGVSSTGEAPDGGVIARRRRDAFPTYSTRDQVSPAQQRLGSRRPDLNRGPLHYEGCLLGNQA